jgi:hypothetical protein
MSVKATTAPRPSGMAIGAETYHTGNIEPSRRKNQSRSLATVSPLARGSNSALRRRIRGPVRAAVVDRRVTVAPEQLLRAVVTQRRDRGRIGEPDSVVRVDDPDRLRGRLQHGAEEVPGIDQQASQFGQGIRHVEPLAIESTPGPTPIVGDVRGVVRGG